MAEITDRVYAALDIAELMEDHDWPEFMIAIGLVSGAQRDRCAAAVVADHTDHEEYRDDLLAEIKQMQLDRDSNTFKKNLRLAFDKAEDAVSAYEDEHEY